MDTPLAQRITKARSSLGWSQAELAQASGIAAAQISRYEQGRSHPRPEAIGKLAKALNVQFEWLLTGEGPMDANLPVQEMSAPKDWVIESIDLPDESRQKLERLAQLSGVTVEAMIYKIILQGLQEAEPVANPRDPGLKDIEKRLARIEAAISPKKIRAH